MVGRIARRLGRPLRMARLAYASGALGDPIRLARRLRHARGYRRLAQGLFGFRWATGLLLAHELGVFRALGGGTRSVQELSRALGVHPRSAEALARILESEGLLRRDGEVLELSELSRDLLAPDAEDSIAPMLELMAAQALSFGEIVSGMRDGRVPTALDVLSDQGRHQAFLDAVNAFLAPAVRDLVRQVDLGDPRELIVGSMGVSASAVLLERFPRARVTYGCLPHLVREIPRLRERYRVPAERVRGMHDHGGDPEADRWGDESFDLVLLTKKMILAPEQRMGERFARKAFEVLRPGGAAVLWECVHSDRGPTPIARAMEAVLDLGASPQGWVNTERSLRKMLGEIGYRDVAVVPCLEGETTFVVARKG